MSVEAIRICADFAADPNFGVNALMPLIPHDPWEEPPPEIVVTDETRDKYVAQRLIPANVNHALMVLLADDATFDGTPTVHGAGVRSITGEVNVLFLYAVRKSAKDVGVRFVKDVLRAARNCCLLLNDPENAARRTANGVILLPSTGFRQMLFNAEKGDALLTSGIVASYDVREAITSINPDV